MTRVNHTGQDKSKAILEPIIMATDPKLVKIARRTLLSGKEVHPADFLERRQLLDPDQEERADMLRALFWVSYHAHELLKKDGNYKIAQVRGVAKALNEGRKKQILAMEDWSDVELYSVMDDATKLDFKPYAKEIAVPKFHVWLVYCAGALLCVDRAVAYVWQNRPYKVGLLLHEAEQLMRDASLAHEDPLRDHLKRALQTKHDRREQDYRWLWNQFKSSAEYRRDAAAEYKVAAENLLNKLKETYPGRTSYPALSMVEKHFRKMLREKDGIEFKPGRRPKSPSGNAPLHVSD